MKFTESRLCRVYTEHSAASTKKAHTLKPILCFRHIDMIIHVYIAITGWLYREKNIPLCTSKVVLNMLLFHSVVWFHRHKHRRLLAVTLTPTATTVHTFQQNIIIARWMKKWHVGLGARERTGCKRYSMATVSLTDSGASGPRW